MARRKTIWDLLPQGFRDYVAAGVTQDPSVDLKRVVEMRAFTKWLFDVVKNVLVVGGVLAVAKKTDDLLFTICGQVLLAFITVYCLSYLMTWYYNPFHGIKRKRLSFVLAACFCAPSAAVLWASILYALNRVVGAIVTANSH